MALFGQVFVNGILLGGLYALMALGLALVWGVLNIVNLAHGAFIMLGAYVAFYLFTWLHLDPVLALPVSMAVLFGLGYAVQRGILGLVIRGPLFNTLLITFGLEVVFTYLAQIAFSADFRTLNPSYAGANVQVAGITLPLVRILAGGIAAALTVAVWLMLGYSRLGRAIRAASQNLTAARLYGVEPRSVYAVTFGLGAGLAGAAGDLYGMVSQINPYIGATLTAKCFVISIIGGLDSALGVIVGGAILGIVEALTSLYIGPTYTDVVSFGILVVVLIARPSGLLGRTT
ncbi:MAG: branched-chain amino acid ABC transporter permease [SAR324 cluster bacterium]